MKKAKKFIEGDRVKISPEGWAKWRGKSCNPACAGTVSQVTGWVAVHWDDGTDNAYPLHSHLMPAE